MPSGALGEDPGLLAVFLRGSRFGEGEGRTEAEVEVPTEPEWVTECSAGRTQHLRSDVVEARETLQHGICFQI